MNNYKKVFKNPSYQGQRDYLPLVKIWLWLIFKINDRYTGIINVQVFKIAEIDIISLYQEIDCIMHVQLFPLNHINV
jgi:hypothetical protein